MRRDYGKIEITDPDRISHEVSGVDHELRFETDLGHGNTSAMVARLTDSDLDALIEAIADRRGSQVYWTLTYRGDGPDSWEGGYDSSDDAAQALREKRSSMRAYRAQHMGTAIMEPGRLVATRRRVVRTEHDEEW